MLQKDNPTNKWLVFDDQLSIRNPSKKVIFPLTEKYELIMKKLIDFVRFSQDPLQNINQQIRPAVGLAAPQIGENVKMYYIRIQENNEKAQTKNVIEHALINPTIVVINSQLVCLQKGEGCLSVAQDHKGVVPRYFWIMVKGYDYLKKEKVFFTVNGYEAIVLQHEQSHLEGKFYYDLINNNDPWKKENDWIIL